MKKVSVIVVCYQSDSVIFDCLDSIKKFNDIGEFLEVILVDNSPTSSLGSDVGGYNVKYVHNPANGGFGQGNNVGASHSNGEILLFLNPDTILVEPIFSDLIGQIEDGYVLGGFTLVSKEGDLNDSFGLLPEWTFLPISTKLVYQMSLASNKFRKVTFPWGASLFVKKSEFLAVGGFDENIFLCNEEPDLVKRIRPNKIGLLKNKIIHLEGHTVSVKPERFQQYLDSSRIYFDKNGLNFILFKTWVFVRLICGFVRDNFRGRRNNKNLDLIRLLFK